MTQSPPKGPASSRPPAAPGQADTGRRITALAAGGSVLLLTASAVVLWPRTYGSNATFVIDGGSSVRNPVALAGRIEAALLSREELATIAMDLPPELRSPDPIGRLRAGIRVQSRGAIGYSVEFRGSDPQSVQRIANHLADRAVTLVPKLASSPTDNAPALALAERSRAVTEFLTAHPEIALESNPGPNATSDSGLDALRTEKRQIEQRLAAPSATDNPYAEPQQDPELLNRRLAELKNIIARREAAMKQPRPSSPSIAPELTAQWRTLLGELASAQAATADGAAEKPPTATAHVTARASLPTSPLTPNRLVLSIVAALLSVAAALVSYVLPRRGAPAKRQGPRSSPPSTVNKQLPPAGPEPGGPAVPQLPAAPTASPLPADNGSRPADNPPVASRSDPPPAGRPASEPPGPIAIQRTVVVTGNSTSSVPPKRSPTSPGGMVAPASDGPPPPANVANVANAAPSPGAHSPPAAPLFGSRPPPGAGSYSVSSSHPPPMGSHGGRRTAVEHLSPLPSAPPPPAVAPNTSGNRRSSSPVNTNPATQIVSRPPALDPDAETWAARFETLPPPAPEDAPRKRSGRWKTQVMGSMVPLEVIAARQERPPASEPAPVPPDTRPTGSTAKAERTSSLPGPVRDVPLDLHQVPAGWSPKLEAPPAWIGDVRDAVLKQLSARRLTIAVTGAAGQARAQVAGSLALALAQSGAQVLLLEADFDHPELHQVMSITMPPGAGFSQQLRARQQTGSQQPWRLVSCSNNLQVLVEGRMRSPGLSSSRALEDALRELKDRYHVLLLHAASLERAAEVRPLTDVVHAVVVARGQQPAALQIGDAILDSLL